MENERETIVVEEKKNKIENIKRKYRNLEMSDATAQKIRKLEITNGILKAAAIAAGVLTAIDIIIPDPLPGLDEAVFTGVTILLGTGCNIIENKINSLANQQDASIKIDEITKLSGQLSTVAQSVNTNLHSRQM